MTTKKKITHETRVEKKAFNIEEYERYRKIFLQELHDSEIENNKEEFLNNLYCLKDEMISFDKYLENAENDLHILLADDSVRNQAEDIRNYCDSIMSLFDKVQLYLYPDSEENNNE